MKSTVTDSVFHAVVQYGILDYAEYHSLLLGFLCGLLCFFVKLLDERVAAVALAFCMIAGLGFLPSVELTYVVNEKPWYYLTGLTVQFGASYLFIAFAQNIDRMYDIVTERA